MLKVPEICLICGSHWVGGHQIPGFSMMPKMRSFYECGASLSCRELEYGAVQLLIKNCIAYQKGNQRAVQERKTRNGSED